METITVRLSGRLPIIPSIGYLELGFSFIADRIEAEYVSAKLSEMSDPVLRIENVMVGITEEMIRYNFPQFKGAVPSVPDMENLYRKALGVHGTRVALVSFDDPGNPSSATVLMPEDDGAETLRSFLDGFPAKPAVESGGIRFSKANRKTGPVGEELLFSEVANDLVDRYREKKAPLRHLLKPKKLNEDEKEIVSQVREDVKNLKECDQYVYVNIQHLRDLGIDERTLGLILGTSQKLSRLHITSSGKIMLVDYDCEIKLDDLSKALYFLYLRHPEGIRIKDLQDHRMELLDLYRSVSGRDDNRAMEDTVDRLVDPLRYNVNPLISRIKKAFLQAFHSNLASRYYIEYENGDRRRERKTIALDRSLVSWDTILR